MSFKLKRKGAPMGLSLNLDSSVIQDNVPVPIVKGLYMGSIHCSFNEVGMRKAGVTHIINTSGTPATYPNTFTYLSISIRDKDYSNLLSCIPACNIFIEAGLESGGSVLVHCTGGRSRSAAIITAYLMSSKRILFEEAFASVKTARSLASCNAGFESQLRAYGEMEHDVHRAHQFLLRQHMERVSEGRRCQEAAVRRLAATTLSNPLRIKLMQPDTASVYIIPPLRGSDMQYVCRKCQHPLFVTSSIICHTPEDNQRASGRTPRRMESKVGSNGGNDESNGNGGSNGSNGRNGGNGNGGNGDGDAASTAAAVAAVERQGAAVLTNALSRGNTPISSLLTTDDEDETRMTGLAFHSSSDKSSGAEPGEASSGASSGAGSLYAFHSTEPTEKKSSQKQSAFGNLAINGDADDVAVVVSPGSTPAAPMTQRHGGSSGAKGKGFDFQDGQDTAVSLKSLNLNDDNSGSGSGNDTSSDTSSGHVSASASGSRGGKDNGGQQGQQQIVIGGREGLEIPRTPPQKWREEDRRCWIDRMKVLECGITRSEKGRHRPSIVADVDEAAAVKVVNRNCTFIKRTVIVW